MKQYLFHINDLKPEEYEKCLSLMSEPRREYINTVTNKERKMVSIAGEWIAKNAIAEKTGLPLEDIEILRTQRGKPYVNIPDIHISISHSSSFVAVVIANKPIGIDIEVIKPLNLKVADRVCSQSDKQLLSLSKDKDEALINFLKIWTAKEAYFKMTGTGITNIKGISYKDIPAVHSIKDSLIITVVT